MSVVFDFGETCTSENSKEVAQKKMAGMESSEKLPVEVRSKG